MRTRRAPSGAATPSTVAALGEAEASSSRRRGMWFAQSTRPKLATWNARGVHCGTCPTGGERRALDVLSPQRPVRHLTSTVCLVVRL